MQHGFREKRSFETKLVMIIEDRAMHASAGKQTDVILLDSSKAVDKVNNRGNKLNWIHTFLGNISQRVVIDGKESDSIPVNSGVS